MPNAFAEVAYCGFAGPEQGLTLTADVRLWGFNYPDDGIAFSDTVTVFPVPALQANWKSALCTAIEAHWPDQHILNVVFPGFVNMVLHLF